MRTCLRCVLSAAAVVVMAGAFAQEAGRPLLVTTQASADREAAVALGDRARWLEDGLAAFHPVVKGGSKGVAVIVGPRRRGIESSGLVNQLGRELTFHGWSTLTLRLPEAADEASVSARMGLALEQARASGGEILLIGEGEAGQWVVATAERLATPLAAVAVNVEDAPAIADAVRPTLLLQEEPHGWADHAPLGEGVDVRLLPRGRYATDDNRVARFLRGWLKRRFQL